MPSARGMAAAIRRLASITPVRSVATAGESGSNQFAIHVVQIHAHHTTSSTNVARATAPIVRSCRISCVSCVIAKT